MNSSQAVAPRSVIYRATRWHLLLAIAVTLFAFGGSVAQASASEVPPEISGTAYDGQTLTASPGTWWTANSNLNFTYQWLRCDLDNVYDCTEIEGATENTLLLTPQEVNWKITVVVTASDGEYSETQWSYPAGPVNALAPTNTVAPSIDGDLLEGETLTANPGSWTGTPEITFEYSWYLCNADGVACHWVEGATGTTFVLTSEMIGKTVAIGVAAQNGGGISGVFGEVTSPVGPNVALTAPSLEVAPEVTGTTTDGHTLTVSDGVWNSYETPVITYQWQRCMIDGSNCTDILGETDATIDLWVVDIRHQLRAVVTATNGTGQDVATTATVGPVNGVPTVTTLPADEITATGARLNGFRDSRLTDGEFAFEFGTDANDLSTRSLGSVSGSESGVYPLNLVLNDLAPSTTYYFRAVADSAIGASAGDLLSFTTEAAPTIPSAAGPEGPTSPRLEISPGAFVVDVHAPTWEMEQVAFMFTLPEAGHGTFTGTVVDDERHVGAEHNRQKSSGKTYTAFSRSFARTRAGAFKLPATLSPRALDKIRQRGFLRVFLKSTFTPAGSTTPQVFRKVVKLRPFAVTNYGTIDGGSTVTATLRTPRTGRLTVKYLLRDRRTGESTTLKAFAERELAGGTYVYTAPLTADVRSALSSGRLRLMVKARLDTNRFAARMLRSRYIRISN